MAEDTRGFTLIELVIVMILLGLLAIVAFPKFIDLTGVAKAEATRASLGSLRSTLYLRYADNVTAGNPSFPSSITTADFATNQLPINKCTGNSGIAVVASAPGGTTEDATNGFWYIVSNGQAGAYANSTISHCANTSNF